MRRICYLSKCIFVIIVFLSLGFSCSTIHTLSVDYSLPQSKSGELKGKKITLAFEDERGTKNILRGGAIDEFESFSGNISLSLIRDSEKTPLGLYEPQSLFLEAFIRRFEDIGVKAVSEKGQGESILTIILKEFSLDLVERKWIVKIGYEAVVKIGGRITYRHNINGEGERLRLLGTTQAETLISEIFTDVINRLDLEKVYSGDL